MAGRPRGKGLLSIDLEKELDDLWRQLLEIRAWMPLSASVGLTGVRPQKLEQSRAAWKQLAVGRSAMHSSLFLFIVAFTQHMYF